jgi:hypothetical protein
MAKHSPGPWFLGTMPVDPGEDGWDGCVWAPPDPAAADDPGCRLEPWKVAEVTSEKDAERIVVCANAHDDLLAALQKLVAAVNCNYDPEAIKSEGYFDAAKAAIAKALGETPAP